MNDDSSQISLDAVKGEVFRHNEIKVFCNCLNCILNMNNTEVNQQQTTFSDIDRYFFTPASTKKLIQLYKEHKPKLRTGEIKSMKNLFQKIAIDLSNFYNITVTADKCENKWKVLERNYKKVTDNNKKTGRGTKIFEYEDEFNDIFGTKKNIYPVTILSSTTTNQELQLEIEESNKENTFQIVPSTSNPIRNTEMPKRKRSYRFNETTYKKRNEVLTEIKNVVKEYYADKKKIEHEKIQLRREKLEESKKKRELLERLIISTD